MASVLSKRQQVRNEKVLQELVQNIPGNDMCADCHARNPAWASWSLGVFLCMRCASIHRKLGTHISKVKSLSMDSWSNEQVDNMRKVGNVASNNIYNPEHRKPPVPVDADEADSAMERFIRQKYTNNVVNGKGKPTALSLDEGTPPPLPPKNSTKFGFRSASSIFPLSSKSKKEAKMAAATEVVRSPTSPRPTSKSSRVFGAALNTDHPDEEQKLAKLRDMGFYDSKRNALVLKGVNGNVERAVEALVRLGEGGRPSPLPTPSPREQTLRSTRSLTPLTPGSGGLGLGAGLSVPSRSATDRPATPSSASTNPFDMMPPAQPQTAQSTGSLQNRNPYSTTGTNPFGLPGQTQPPKQLDAFSQAFENMSLSTPQPLFPHHTGGPALQPTQQPGIQQSMAPSAPTSPNSYTPINHAPMTFNSNMTYPQPVPPQSTAYNPFFSDVSSTSSPVRQQPFQQVTQQPQALNTAQPHVGYNPFARSPIQLASPSLSQIPEQTQTSFQSPSTFQSSLPFQSTGVYQSPAPMQQESATNPFFASTAQSSAQSPNNPFGPMQASQPQPTQQMSGQQQQQQPNQQLFNQQGGQQAYGQLLFGQQTQQQTQLQPQPQQQYGQQLFGVQPQQPQQKQLYQPQRPSNASIMALYGNYPQLTPQKPGSAEMPQHQQQIKPSVQPLTIPENQQLQIPTAATAPISRSSTQTLSPTTNPFLNNTTSSMANTTKPDPFAARSRESMSLVKDLAWTNGRHSPDAFASLSARHG